jgi:hypothetical protein
LVITILINGVLENEHIIQNSYPIVHPSGHEKCNRNATEMQQERILIMDDQPDVNIELQSVSEQNRFKTESYNDPVLAYKNFRKGLYNM